MKCLFRFGAVVATGDSAKNVTIKVNFDYCAKFIALLGKYLLKTENLK